MTLAARRGTLEVMAACAWALLSIVLATPALAAADIVEDLASSDLAVRRLAVSALADEATIPPAMVEPLVARLHDSDLVVADAAVRALGHGKRRVTPRWKRLLPTSS